MYSMTDLGTEAYMAEAWKLASGEWRKLFIGILILTVILVSVCYVKINNNIRIAGGKGEDVKVCRLKWIRHAVAAVIVLAAAGTLVFTKVYMKPYNISFDADTYNTWCWSPYIYDGEYIETEEVTLNLVIKRSVFGNDDVFGTVITNGIKYIVRREDCDEEGDIYILWAFEEGAAFPVSPLIIKATKNFEIFTHENLSSTYGVREFVGPAGSVEEAKDIYERWDKVSGHDSWGKKGHGV